MKSEYLNNKEFERVITNFQNFKQEKNRFEFIIEDVTESNKKRKKHKKTPAHDLKVYSMECQRASGDYSKSQSELALAFYTLAEHLVRYAKDIIVDIDDAIQEGVVICFEKIDRFNPEKGKAFNYLTTCVLNHYRQLWRTHKNYKLLKERFKNFQMSRMSNIYFKNGKETMSSDE